MVSPAGDLGAAVLTLSVDEGPLNRGLTEAQRRTSATFDRMGRDARLSGLILSAAITAPLVGIGSLAIRAQLDFQKAFANVEKSVQGTDAQINTLRDDIRRMAGELPDTAVSIAEVAAAGGRLGIATENLEQFTRVAIDLGHATDLASEEAITGITQFMNVMGTAPGEVRNLADTLTFLGNQGASSGQEILNLALRIGGTARIFGLTEDQVLGLSNGIRSLGIPSERAGTALSTTFTKIAQAVAQGGEALDKFARVAGLSREEFARIVEVDPGSAFLAFIKGLERMRSEGQEVFGVLEDLQLGNVRTVATLLAAAGGFDTISKSMRDATDNTKTAGEAARVAGVVYETDAAKLQMFANRANDVAISLGGKLVPALLQTLGTVEVLGRDFIEFFESIPEPVRKLTFGLLALGVALGPIIFAFGNLRLVAFGALGVIQALGGAFRTLTGIQSAQPINSTAQQMLAVRQQAEAATLATRQAAAQETLAARQRLAQEALLARQRIATDALLISQAATKTQGASASQTAAREVQQIRQEAARTQLQTAQEAARIRLQTQQQIERDVQAVRQRSQQQTLAIRQGALDVAAPAVSPALRATAVQAAQAVPKEFAAALKAENLLLDANVAKENAANAAKNARIVLLNAEARAQNTANAAKIAESNLSTRLAVVDAERVGAMQAATRAADAQDAARQASIALQQAEGAIIFRNNRAIDAQTGRFVSAARARENINRLRIQSEQAATAASQASLQVESSRLRFGEAFTAAENARTVAISARRVADEAAVAAINAKTLAERFSRDATIAKTTADQAAIVAETAKTRASQAAAVAYEAERVAAVGAGNATRGFGLASVGALANWALLAASIAAGIIMWKKFSDAAKEAELQTIRTSLETAKIQVRDPITGVFKVAETQKDLQPVIDAYKGAISQIEDSIAQLEADILAMPVEIDVNTGLAVDNTALLRRQLDRLREDLEKAKAGLFGLENRSDALAEAERNAANATNQLSGEQKALANTAGGASSWIAGLVEQYEDLDAAALGAKLSIALLQQQQAAGGEGALVPKLPTPEELAGLTAEDAEQLLRDVTQARSRAISGVIDINAAKAEARKAIAERRQAMIEAKRLEAEIAGPRAAEFNRQMEELDDIINPPRPRKDAVSDTQKALEQFLEQRRAQQAEAVFEGLQGLGPARAQLEAIESSTVNDLQKLTASFDVLDNLWVNEAIPALAALGLAVDDTFRIQFENAVGNLEKTSQLINRREQDLLEARIRDIPGIQHLQNQLLGVERSGGSHLQTLRDQYQILDRFWAEVAVPTLRSAGVQIKDATHVLFDDIASEVLTGKAKVQSALTGLGGFLEQLATRQLAMTGQLPAGVAINPNFVPRNGVTQNIAAMNFNVLKGEVPGGIDAPLARVLVRESFEEALAGV